MTKHFNAGTHYRNAHKQEGVRRIYTVHLMDQKYLDAYVKVKAESEEEAKELALASNFAKLDWEFFGPGEYTEVLDVTCEGCGRKEGPPK